MRCFVTVHQDRTYDIIVRPPATSFLLKRAAGIEKASTEKKVARISAKVVYELALLKQTDPKMQHMSVHQVYGMMLASAIGYGFEII